MLDRGDGDDRVAWARARAHLLARCCGRSDYTFKNGTRLLKPELCSRSPAAEPPFSGSVGRRSAPLRPWGRGSREPPSRLAEPPARVGRSGSPDIGRAGAADNFQKTAHIPKRVLKMGAGAEAAHAGVPGDPAIPGLRSGGLLHLRSQWQHAANFRTENLLNTAGIMGAMGRVVRGQPVVR